MSALFFFQAEDGIRDGHVTGVQTCALPILVEKLRQNGIERVLMLTGDNQQTAESIAKQAGIDEVHASLLPEDKLQIVKSLHDEGHVTAMIGDRINDAQAPTAADIAIAMGMAGNDDAVETADIAM